MGEEDKELVIVAGWKWTEDGFMSGGGSIFRT